MRFRRLSTISEDVYRDLTWSQRFGMENEGDLMDIIALQPNAA